MRNRKVTGTASTIPMGVGLGMLTSLTVTLVGSALTAYLINSETIREDGVGFSAMIVLVLSAAAGAWIAMWRIKRLRMQMCLLTGLCYFLALIALTALFFGGQYDGVIVTALAVLCGCGSVAILGSGAERRGRRVRRKSAYR